MRIKLGIPMSLGEIASICNSKAANPDVIITHVTTNSAKVKKNDLFVCIKGNNFNGEDFTDEVIAKGGFPLSTRDGSSHICVESTKVALLSLANNFTKKLTNIKKKIAITGSVGKTTTKDLIHHLLCNKYVVHKTEGNKNNHIGLPLTTLSAPKNTEILDIEMGMNHRGEIKELSECLAPDIGIINNIGSSHIGNLGSREEIAKAKLEILEGMGEGTILIPYEEALLSEARNKMTFSTVNSNADFYLKFSEAKDLSIYFKGNHFCSAKFTVSAHHLKKCLAPAVSAAMLCGITREEIKDNISVISDDIFGQKIVNCGKLSFYLDCYNASAESIQSSFETLKRIEHDGRKCLLLGDIGELGEHSEKIHFEVGGSIPRDLFTHLYFFGEQSEIFRQGALSSGFSNDCIFTNCYIDRPDITAQQIKEHSKDHDLILVKGSRFMRLERILDFFERRKER